MSPSPTAAVAMALVAGTASGITLTEYGSVDLPSAAVASFSPDFLGTNGDALLVTTFSPTADNDAVLMMTGLKEVKQGSTNDTIITTLDPAAVWPNQASAVAPGTVTGVSTPTALQAGGFFVSVPGHPSKADGTVDLLVADSDKADGTASFTKQTISSYKKSNFYHHAEWLDVNQDGRMDVIAARCYEPQYFGNPDSELIWIEQPEDPADEWETHVTYSNGPDVAFTVVDLDGDGSSQLIATEFFVNQRLALYHCDGSWADCDQDSTQVIVIDDTEGVFFDLQWVDLNADGVRDLLVTTQGDKGKGKVLAYEVPKDWSTGGAWTKHVLADGYAPLHSLLPGQGSPGAARAFDLSGAIIGKYILVTADDGGFVDVLVPSGVWTYDKVTVIESTGTIGTPSVGDVDGDSIPEVFVPLFDEGRLAMYTIEGI